MDLTAIYDADRLVIDDVISVTLTRPASYTGAQAAITVNNVLAREARQKNADGPMGGFADETVTTFHLWLAECLSMPPFRDYQITKPDGTIWVIKDVQIQDHGRRFRCPDCVQRQDNTP